MKKETLEETAERLYPTDYGVKSKDIINIIKQDTFINGAKWEQERSYSEEDMKSFADWCRNGLLNTEYSVDRLNKHLEQWKQFKNK